MTKLLTKSEVWEYHVKARANLAVQIELHIRGLDDILDRILGD